MLEINSEVINFVNQYLACNYKEYYMNPNYRNDMLGEVFLEICEHRLDYDENIAGYKAFVTPLIKKGMLKFTGSLHGTTEYYEKVRAKIIKAAGALALKGEQLSAENITKEAGCSKKSFKGVGYIPDILACNENSSHESNVSLEALSEEGTYEEGYELATESSIEDAAIINNELEQVKGIWDFFTDDEKALILAKADSFSKKEFLKRAKALGHDMANKDLAKIQNKAKRLMYKKYGVSIA